jgi:hypothetical protein
MHRNKSGQPYDGLQMLAYSMGAMTLIFKVLDKAGVRPGTLRVFGIFAIAGYIVAAIRLGTLV